MTCHLLQLLFSPGENCALSSIYGTTATLTIRSCLLPPTGWGSLLRGIYCDRISGRVFIDISGTVANPLAPAVHRDSDVEFDLTHLKRSRMVVPHEIPD